MEFSNFVLRFIWNALFVDFYYFTCVFLDAWLAASSSCPHITSRKYKKCWLIWHGSVAYFL